jgi:hypothetical protein
MDCTQYETHASVTASNSDTRNMEIGMLLKLLKKHRTFYSSNCFSNAETETDDDWIRSFSFVWNPLI